MEHYEDWEQEIDQKLKEKKNDYLVIAIEKAKKDAEFVLQTFKQKIPDWKHFEKNQIFICSYFFEGKYSQDALRYEVSQMLRGIGFLDVWRKYEDITKHTTVCVEIASLLKEHIDTLYIEDTAYQYIFNQNVITKKQRLLQIFEENKETPIIITPEEEEELSILMRMIMKKIIDFTFLQKKNLADILHAILQFKEHRLYKTKTSILDQLPPYDCLRKNIEIDSFHSLIERYKRLTLQAIDQEALDLILSGQIRFKKFQNLRNYLYLASNPTEMRNKLKEGIIKNIEEQTEKIDDMLKEDGFDFLYYKTKLMKEKEIVKNLFNILEQVRKDEQDETNI